MEVVAASEDDFEHTYEHRRNAKDRSYSAAVLDDQGPLNVSSFGELHDSSAHLELLYSKSTERDRNALQNLQVLSVVGRGNFGKVFLVHLE